MLLKEEKLALLHMLDDEELAKKIYEKFYQLYPEIYYFNKIKNSEIVHKTSLLNVLKNYNIDVENNNNKFLNKTFVEKYHILFNKGKENLKSALLVSIDIEIEDILDLEKILNNENLFKDKIDIKEMLKFLLQGSYNHYNMYKKLLKELYDIDICNLYPGKCIKKPFKKEVWIDYKEWYWFNKNVNF